MLGIWGPIPIPAGKPIFLTGPIPTPKGIPIIYLGIPVYPLTKYYVINFLPVSKHDSVLKVVHAVPEREQCSSR